MDPHPTNPASGSLHHTGGAAGLGLSPRVPHSPNSKSKGRGYRHLELGESLVCVHPGCEDFNWLNEALLDEHIKKEHTIIETVTDSQSHPSDQASQGYRTACGSSAASDNTTPTPVINDTQVTQLDFVQWRPANRSDSESSPSTQPAKPYRCTYEGCNSSFLRKGDCTRHLKNHSNGSRPFDCFADGCKRKGNNGFTRVDKLKEHVSNQHPLSDLSVYTKGTFAQTGNDLTDVHQFQSWRDAKRNWQTAHPSDEMPPWLTGESWLTQGSWWYGKLWCDSIIGCPQCQKMGKESLHSLSSLGYHWQTNHTSIEMPLWMTIDELPQWVRAKIRT